MSIKKMQLLPIIFQSLEESITIVLIIFALMVIIELLILKYEKRNNIWCRVYHLDRCAIIFPKEFI